MQAPFFYAGMYGIMEGEHSADHPYAEDLEPFNFDTEVENPAD
jgi:hypothetical protein